MADSGNGSLIAGGTVGGLSAVNNIISELRMYQNDEAARDAISSLTGDFSRKNYEDYLDPEERLIYEYLPSEYNNIQVDPSVLSAQNRALDELINLSESKGLNAIDRQALQEIVDAENRNLQGQQNAIMQDAMQRGVYGSGLEMANRLQAAQSSANRMNNQDMEVMSQAQQRALEALSGYGNLASNMRSQDFSEQEKIAAANDAINRANIENRQNVSNLNTDDRNKTRAGNTEVHNANIDAKYQAQVDKANFDKDKVGLQVGQLNTANKTIEEMKKDNDKWLGSMGKALGSAFDSSDGGSK